MKPSFALSLSFDGIRLLHRAAGGWRVVGDVALDAEDMSAELAVLRRTATALEPGGVRTKVLLPNEQIKYLSIETPGLDDDARRAAAAAALDGATPYAVADLSFDISADGDTTHVAAVARETLAEAEAFAAEHRLHPVSFAAIPGKHPYLGEPFFGVASGAAALLEADESVEPDGIAVVVVGDIVAPVGPVASDAKSEDTDTAPPPKPLPEPTVEAAPIEPSPDAEKAPLESAEVAATDTDATEPEPVPVLPSFSSAAATPPADSDAATPTLGFASRRAPDKPAARQLDGVKRDQPAPIITAPLPDPAAASVAAPRIEVEPEQRSTPIPAPAATSFAPAEAAPARTGFLSRRKTTAAPTAATPIPASAHLADPEGAERERMTVFGARKSQVGGKPRFLGLILTAALLVFLAGVAAWASVFLDDGISLSRLFKDREVPETATTLPEPVLAPEPVAAPEPQVEIAALDPALTEEDTAVLDALRDTAQPVQEDPPTEADLEASYAATGIWPQAPLVPPEPATVITLDDLYLTSIDPVSTTTDAVALPDPAGYGVDVVLATVLSPAAAGTVFALNDQGLVIPTAQGALSPEGFTVFLGRPPLVPPAVPTRFEEVPEDTAVRTALAARRPQPRPTDLVEQSERAQLDGLTRTELAGYRPALRPPSLQQQAEAAAAPPPAPEAPIVTDGAVALALAAPDPTAGATQYAVRASVRPDLRPGNFARIVKRAQRSAPQQQEEEEVRVATAGAVAPAVVAPRIPSKTSVAQQATVKNAINLRDVNLIGVYGKPSSRRALVRLGNGRYQKVVVGDRIDGGRVSAIGDGELRYTKRGRDVVLKMPR